MAMIDIVTIDMATIDINQIILYHSLPYSCGIYATPRSL